MKIGEIIEALKQGKQLAEIGKELMVGKEKLSKALKEAGYTFSRRTGWTFTGTGEEPLNKDYTDFVKSSRTVIKQPVTHVQKEVAATTEKAEASNNPTYQLSNKTESKQENNPTNKQINKQVGKPEKQPTGNPTIKTAMKKVTYEIEEQLHDELKIRSIRDKRTVSEIVNEIIKNGLNNKL